MRTLGRRRPFAAPLLAMALAACAAPGSSGEEAATATDAAQETRPPFSTFPVPSVQGGDTATPPDGVPGAIWTAILDDLEERAGGAAADPALVSVEQVTWNDGSLGCPQPDLVYTQALVDGYRVIVEIQGERFDYRVGSGAEVRLCEGNGPLEGEY